MATALNLILTAALLTPAGATQSGPESSGGSAAPQDDLTELSLAELMEIEVTIASRSSQSLQTVPGAVYVISGDELRRSGHTTVQEALRMVPGVYVSNWTSSKWDVISRGFGAGSSLSSFGFLNQLLIMVDGVTVYSPLFAGTWWGIQDVALDDVDRIEVIRGPGGLLWGSNAIHGVVHVITKSSADTLGTRVSLRGGTDEWNASGRFGARIDEHSSYRFFYRYADRDGNANPYLGFNQDWYLRTAGARFDWGVERKQTFWLRGYEGRFGEVGYDPIAALEIPTTDEKSGVQAYGSSTSPDGQGTVSAWVSYDDQQLETLLDQRILSYDLEYRRVFELSASTRLTAGVGVRRIESDLRGADPLYLAFESRKVQQTNARAFVVHEWAVSPALNLTFGLQAEDNEFSDFQVQPTARVHWSPSPHTSLWAAVTRSVRTPSLEEVGLDQNSLLIGSADFDTEKALSFELGLRRLIGELVSLDVTAFYNDYDDLHNEEFDGVGQYQLTNGGDGESYGLELALDLKPSERWSLRSGYAYVARNIDSEVNFLSDNDFHPDHIFNLRSYYDLTEKLELDSSIYIYEGLGRDFEVAERWRADLRVAYHPEPDLELYVGAQQLNDDTIAEYDDFDNRRRQFYVGLRWSAGGE